MRWIDLTKLNVSTEWKNKATAAQTTIDSDPDLNSSEYPNIWSELKEELKTLSYNKCWYCEARENRSDNAVDHFRPKSKYKWLTYNPNNFRFACTFCNSRRTDHATGQTGGKGNYFPLLDPTTEAKDDAGLRSEKYVLLDPCDPLTPSIIIYDDEGIPKPSLLASAIDKQRLETSIQYYHLNHSELVEMRRQLGLQINEWVNEANDYFLTINEPSSKTAFTNKLKDLCRLIKPESQLSTFARCIIQGHKDKAWIDSLFQMM
ncbi:hypothetical protein P255_01929 [Acinetobacter brisouii CIP 110357]|uniref:HNH nuclease domain-containing protein n=1 Tax=Acinetobacter brisouii CIP 110357 TaxID=1341683 RepID=V2VUJ6_9GAMM|nr:HNH endonuclease [Acinetobacter brisouii]ENV47612.1 TIGR02646 family protein [Acinetobacter brisouii ANC 4119]ESK51414.1 hypothetical protein P255_01929 [Acinetobacter brisouii CIP 110357]